MSHSLESFDASEDSNPPLTGDGSIGADVGRPRIRTAWEEDGHGSIHSDLQTYDSESNFESMQQEILDLREKVKMQELAHETELGKYKHQLQHTHHSDSNTREAELEAQLDQVRRELALANEKVYEFEQELGFNSMYNNESLAPSLPESTAEMQTELEKLKETLSLKDRELMEKSETLRSTQTLLDSTKRQATHFEEQLMLHNNQQSGAESAREEVERLKASLKDRERELMENKEAVSDRERTLEECRVMLTSTESDLEEARKNVSRTERDLERTKRQLESTKEQLESAKRDAGEGERAPRRRADEKLHIKLNAAMAAIEKHKKVKA